MIIRLFGIAMVTQWTLTRKSQLPGIRECTLNAPILLVNLANVLTVTCLSCIYFIVNSGLEGPFLSIYIIAAFDWHVLFWKFAFYFSAFLGVPILSTALSLFAP